MESAALPHVNAFLECTWNVRTTLRLPPWSLQEAKSTREAPKEMAVAPLKAPSADVEFGTACKLAGGRPKA